MRQGPLAGRYAAVAGMVMFALIPYLALSAALGPLTPIISKQLHISLQTLSLGGGLGNAAYATGTVLAVQFAQHLPQRRMMVIYAVILVIGSLLEALAQDAAMFLIGHILQGLCTSLLLIAAVPPLAIGFPQDKLRDTAVIMNLCIFGAVALGPLIGGIQAEANNFRPLFWIIAGISVIALLLTILTFEDAPPGNPDSPSDPLALFLAAVGCVAAFFGASELTTHAFISWWTLAPLAGGLIVIAILIIYQTIAKNPLLAIKTMLSSSIPVAGIIVALFAAAASVSATDLTLTVLNGRYSPAHIGLLYLPEVGGAVLTAFALGIVIRHRSLHYLPLFGMLALAAGIVIFRISVPSSQAMTLVGSGLTGLGLGATVAPALFVAGFSLPAANLQRVFAIVELMRAVAAFMIAPIFAHFAVTVGRNADAGTGIALWIGLGIALLGAGLAILIYLFSGARPQSPDFDTFLGGQGPAWHSPPLLARLRGIDPNTKLEFEVFANTMFPGAGAAADGDGAPAEAGDATGAGAAAGAANGAVAGNGSAPTPSADLPSPAPTSAVPVATAAVTPVAHNGNGNGNGAHAGRDTVLIAYDGSVLAGQAIQQAGTQLQGGREALILVVWAPADVLFTPVNGPHFNADQATEVRQAAEETAAHGVALAREAGFNAQALTIEASPSWKGIVQAAEQNHVGLIVIGSHRHTGVAGHLSGSVAESVMAHSQVAVLVVHQPAVNV